MRQNLTAFLKTTTGQLVEKAVYGAVITIVLALANDPNAIKVLVALGIPYSLVQFVLNLIKTDVRNI